MPCKEAHACMQANLHEHLVSNANEERRRRYEYAYAELAQLVQHRSRKPTFRKDIRVRIPGSALNIRREREEEVWNIKNIKVFT